MSFRRSSYRTRFFLKIKKLEAERTQLSFFSGCRGILSIFERISNSMMELYLDCVWRRKSCNVPYSRTKVLRFLKEDEVLMGDVVVL